MVSFRPGGHQRCVTGAKHADHLKPPSRRPARSTLVVAGAATTETPAPVNLSVRRNPNFGKLKAGYLFPEVGTGGGGGWPERGSRGSGGCCDTPAASTPASGARGVCLLPVPVPDRLPPPQSALQIAKRRRAHQEKHPEAKIISLGIGDTTEPLPKTIADAMAKHAAGMATREGYSGCVGRWMRRGGARAGEDLMGWSARAARYRPQGRSGA